MTTGEKIVVGVLGAVAIFVAADALILNGAIPSLSGLLPSGGTGSGVFADGTSAVDAIFNAITTGENVNTADNNPAGICAAYDSQGNCTGIVHYGTYAEGAEAAKALIQKYLVNDPSITVAQFVQKWTGGANSGYLATILSALHLGANDPIAQAGGGSTGGDSDGDDGSDDEDNPDDGDEGDGDDDD